MHHLSKSKSSKIIIVSLELAIVVVGWIRQVEQTTAHLIYTAQKSILLKYDYYQCDDIQYVLYSAHTIIQDFYKRLFYQIETLDSGGQQCTGRLGLRMRAYCCSRPVLLQITKTDLYFLRHGKKGNDSLVFCPYCLLYKRCCDLCFIYMLTM